MIEQPWWAEGPADHEARFDGPVVDPMAPLHRSAVYAEAEVDPEQGSTVRSVVVGGVVLLTAVVLTAAVAGLASRPGVDLRGLVPAAGPAPAAHLQVRGATRTPRTTSAPGTVTARSAAGSATPRVARTADTMAPSASAGVRVTARTTPTGDQTRPASATALSAAALSAAASSAAPPRVAAPPVLRAPLAGPPRGVVGLRLPRTTAGPGATPSSGRERGATYGPQGRAEGHEVRSTPPRRSRAGAGPGPRAEDAPPGVRRARPAARPTAPGRGAQHEPGRRGRQGTGPRAH